jgi:hypothetical protein
MKFPVTVVMRKKKVKTQRAEAVDRAALRYLAGWIIDHWRKGYSFNILQSE